MLDREFVLNEWLQWYRNAVAAVLEHVFLFQTPILALFHYIKLQLNRRPETQQTIWTCRSNTSSYSICIDLHSIFLPLLISGKDVHFELFGCLWYKEQTLFAVWKIKKNHENLGLYLVTLYERIICSTSESLQPSS